MKHAWRLHRHEARKGTGVPYLGQLLASAATVPEHGGDEDLAIAALLRDAIEDQSGPPRRAEIEELFGKRVANVVEGCTEPFGDPKPPWLDRKQAYLWKIATASPDVHLVSMEDKLDNVRAIIAGYREEGERVWARLDAGKEQQLREEPASPAGRLPPSPIPSTSPSGVAASRRTPRSR